MTEEQFNRLRGHYCELISMKKKELKELHDKLDQLDDLSKETDQLKSLESEPTPEDAIDTPHESL